MGRGGKTWVKDGNTFDWLEIYEPVTYFPLESLSIIFKNRNMLLNILILILMLTLKSVKRKEAAINSSIPPTTNLESNLARSLKRDYPLHLQLTMQYCRLQSSFP